jgi:hypothetical protein
VRDDGVHRSGVHEQDRDRPGMDDRVAGEVLHPGVDSGVLLEEHSVAEQVVDKLALQEFARVYSFRQFVSGEPSTEAGRAGLPAAWARKGELRSSMLARWGLPGLGARAKSRPIAGPSADVARHPRADNRPAITLAIQPTGTIMRINSRKRKGASMPRQARGLWEIRVSGLDTPGRQRR